MISHSPLCGIVIANGYELLATCILPARLHHSTVTLVLLPVRGDIRDSLLSLARQKYNEVSNANPPIHAQTADELWSHIMRFTNDLPVDRTTNAYDAWPFVELVSIGGPFAVLERNIILADTPGQDDIDLIAETSVMSYLLRCTIVIVAHKIDRILSTRSLQKMIRARCGCPVAVVATC
jgi:hypothetical protein